MVWAALCGAALTVLSNALGPDKNLRFGVVGVIGSVLTTYELFAALYCLGMTLLLASTIAALLSLILRLRRARGGAAAPEARPARRSGADARELCLEARRGAQAGQAHARGCRGDALAPQGPDAGHRGRRETPGLRPPSPALDDLGLVSAISQQAESHGFVYGDFSEDAATTAVEEDRVVFSSEAPEDLLPLPAAVEVACYRIAQEALTNVARHAYAKTCGVDLSVDRAGGVLQLEVRDDGVGMPEARRAGVGLSSMRERAEELGGTCVVEPGPEGGTRVLARLPMPNPEEHSKGVSSSWSAPSASS